MPPRGKTHTYLLYMKKNISIILLMWLVSICNAQTKHALLIGISRYNTATTGWEKIHGTNDIALMKKVLNGFSVETLLNEQATFSNIKKSLEELTNKVQQGDIVYIHMSGHGQPFEDFEGEETDGWDESFIPYDANMKYKKGYYEGENHLSDDILHRFIETLRKKLGKRGVLYVVIDACHSGASYMGGGSNNVSTAIDDIFMDDLCFEEEKEMKNYERGTAYGFSKNKKIYKPADVRPRKSAIIPSSDDQSKIVMLEACEENQKSYEISLRLRSGGKIYCGLLSYSIYKSIVENKMSISTNTSWIKKVNKYFYSHRPAYSSQKLVIERSR